MKYAKLLLALLPMLSMGVMFGRCGEPNRVGVVTNRSNKQVLLLYGAFAGGSVSIPANGSYDFSGANVRIPNDGGINVRFRIVDPEQSNNGRVCNCYTEYGLSENNNTVNIFKPAGSIVGGKYTQSSGCDQFWAFTINADGTLELTH